MGLSTDKDLRGTGGLWEPASVGDRFSRIGACGVSFGRGVFRFHDSTSGPVAQQDLVTALPTMNGHAEVIAFDWLGRQYAVVSGAVNGTGRPEVCIVDPSTMGLTGLVPPENFLAALQDPLFLDAVENELFESWRSLTDTTGLAFDRCVSLKVPGFLSGRLELANLEETDISVYWHLLGQMWHQTADVPAGTPVRDIGAR